MIDRQVAQWSGTHMAEYLQPSTLFGKSKFDQYFAKRDEPVRRDEGKLDVQLRAVDEAIAKHPANRESTRYRADCTQGERDGLKSLRDRRAGLIEKIAGGAQ